MVGPWRDPWWARFRLGRFRLAVVAAVAAALLACTPGASQPGAPGDQLPAPRKRQDEDSERDRPKKTEGPEILPVSFGGCLEPALPAKLLDVLRLAVLANLDIVQA